MCCAIGVYAYVFLSYGAIGPVLSLKVWLEGSRGQTGGGDQGDRSFRNLPAEGHGTDLWSQARLEERCPMCREDPVVKTTGDIQFS